MTDSPDGVVVANGTFPASSRVRIADLQQQRGAADRYIEASVSLVWPYSSSTHRFSLLLAELDGGAGIARQQVKATFRNGAAKAAQASRVGIGDIVRLGLDGCTWAKRQDEVSTPGKRLDFDVEFTRSLKMEVNPGQNSDRMVNYQWSASPSPETSPSVHGVIALTGSIASVPTEMHIQLSSPLSRKSLRISSGSFVQASLDPFAEDKDYVYARSRKRSKFARESGSWRLLDGDDDDNVAAVDDHDKQETLESASEYAEPLHPTPLEEVEAALQLSHIPPESVRLTSPAEVYQDQPEQSVSEPVTPLREPPEDLMPPPQRPSQTQVEARYITLPENAAEDVPTPRLHPLPSPGLPLVSPLISGLRADGGFFSAVAAVSELDATATSAHSHTNSVASISSGELLPVDVVSVHEEETETAAVLQPIQTEIPDAADEEMHFTPSQLEESSPPGIQPARNMLDVLEEFLLMSPTSSEAVQNLQPAASALSTTEGSERNPSFDVKAGSGPAVLLFRYAKDAVPSTKRGDAVILRDFKVETRNHEPVLLSTSSSSWAVFDGSLDERTMVEEAVISGPPLEYGKGEAGQVRKMVRWWASEGNSLFPDKRNTLVKVEDANYADRHVDSSPQSREQVRKISIEATPTPGEEAALESIEEATRSVVGTRRVSQTTDEVTDKGRSQLEEESKEVKNGKQVFRTPGKGTAPDGRRVSRGTKTPSANTGSKRLSSSPQQPSSQRSQGKLQTGGSRRRTRSPSFVHELRDGKGYVDGRPKEDLHELRNGTKYVDGE
ncbi:hypothetical protein DV735_g1818, partial [Chaetothyriales sp. CBS 134920]